VVGRERWERGRNDSWALGPCVGMFCLFVVSDVEQGVKQPQPTSLSLLVSFAAVKQNSNVGIRLNF
jgi:hypothetical protein